MKRGDPNPHRGLKMFKKRSRKEVRKKFFSWNHEKREVVQKKKTSGFKKGFDEIEKERRVDRQGRDERLYKLLYRVDNVG